MKHAGPYLRSFCQRKVFAGIGNRDAPDHILRLCVEISALLAEHGWTLRTGGADGCDQAFLATASLHAEVYVPWNKFNGFLMRWPVPKEAFTLAASYHPSLNHAKPTVAALHARNMMQVLGPDLESPSDFVVCYTRNGREENYPGFKHECGTDTAITCARANGIPVINIKNPGWSELLSSITGVDFLHLEYP